MTHFPLLLCDGIPLPLRRQGAQRSSEAVAQQEGSRPGTLPLAASCPRLSAQCVVLSASSECRATCPPSAYLYHDGSELSCLFARVFLRVVGVCPRCRDPTMG